MHAMTTWTIVGSGVLQEYPEPGTVSPGIAAAFAGVFLLVWGILFLLALAGVWKTFEKAGRPGWAVLIPIYNVVVLLEIAGKPVWWIVLLLVPLVNLVVGVLVSVALAERFGKGAGFGIGLLVLPFIFYPVLGFGGATYRG